MMDIKYVILILDHLNWRDIFGWIFIFTAILDALKYRWNAAKIRQFHSSKGHSRKFINAALLNDVVRLIYALIIRDWYILWSSIIALICMAELFILIYWYYPYKNRSYKNFKRPNLWIYFINSLTPNRWAKKL